jgi:type VI secretion system protein ImpJ
MPNKPVWSEGLLLSQHHLQQQDRYHEWLLRDRIQAITHYDWGVTALELDERALASGQFKIRRFAAVWPDGLSVSCGEASEQPPPPRSFEGVFGADATKLEVYVGIAHESETASHLESADDPSGARRFTRAVHDVSDLNTGTSAQPVEWAKPNLRIFFGNERQDGFSSIRVAELVRDQTGRAIVRDNYVPPVMHLPVAPFLSAGLQRVLAGVTARQRQLSAERRQRQAGTIEFHASDARKFWLLHTLNSSIPHLHHLVDTKRVHPEEAYLLLVSLAGQLCSFAADGDPTALPKFNYLELGDVFEELFARVLSLLSGGIEQPYVEIPLEHRPDGMFIGKLPEPRLASHEMFIAVQSKLAEGLVRERVPAVLKMAGWNQIYEVVKQARHGVRVEIEWNPSGALPLKPGVCFFRVRREGPFWDDVARTTTIALYLPVDPDWSGTTISMYAVDPTQLR